MASAVGGVKSLELLLAKGSDVNAECFKGLTPLTVAIQGGREDCTRILLAQGGKATIWDLTPRMISTLESISLEKNMPQFDVATNLSQNDFKLRKMLPEFYDEDKYQQYLKSCKRGESNLIHHLCWAASNGFLTAIKTILKKGISVNAQNQRWIRRHSRRHFFRML